MLKKFEVFFRNFKISPKIAFSKVINGFISKYQNRIKRKKDYKFSTYSEIPNWLKEINYSYYHAPSKKSLEIYRDTILKTADLTINHYFNFLGSGWIKVFHGTETPGVEGLNYQSKFRFTYWKDWLSSRISKQNLAESYKISQIISPDYLPIDWQLDFKSGYRWNELSWYKDIKYGDVPGADIKIPWELGRMQSLINLAYASILTKEDDSDKKSDKYSYDFRNQVLGFNASNPPRFGVQWMSSMDVGIRAVNWLISYDFFRANGIEFDVNFKKIFARSIFDHGIHIVNNLEWSSGLRGNHYISNVVSLLFISAFLPISEISTLWLAFSIQEVLSEIEFQFYEEGANFEESTSYHLLSSEMVFHAIALIMALPQDKISSLLNYKTANWNYKKKLFPIEVQKYYIDKNLSLNINQNIWDRLKSIALFSYAISSPTGKYPQIGDNDSGRFIKLTPYFRFLQKEDMESFSNFPNKSNLSCCENVNNDQRIPLSIYAGIVNCQMLSKDDNAIAPYYPILEYEIISKLLSKSTNCFCQLTDDDLKDFVSCDKLDSDDREQNSGMLSFAFPKFGLFINKSPYFYSTIKCGPIGMFGKGGHSHNDQLSFTLMVGNNEIFVDPGTYVYTPLPLQRNNFRSVLNHNTLTIENLEQNLWSETNKDDLFWISKVRTNSSCFQFSNNIFIGEHYAYLKPHKRILSFSLGKIEGIDICELNNKKSIRFHLAPDIDVELVDERKVMITSSEIYIELTSQEAIAMIEDYNYSSGYGIIRKSKRIVFNSNESHIHWKLKIK